MLNLDLNQVTKRHERLIADTYSSNPSARLESIAETLNEMPEMATCFVDITPDLLKRMGYKERKPKKEKGGGNGVTTASAASANLSASLLRSQLEERHRAIEERIFELLKVEVLTTTQTKALQILTSIDEKLITQLVEMMNQEAAPLLPQAIMIRSLRRLGVPEDQLILIDIAIEM